MQTLERLRSWTSRRGILLWMLLTAYVCAPLAPAAQPGSRTVLVPFCTGSSHPARGHDAPAPRSIALHFAATHTGASGPFALPADARAGLTRPIPEARVALMSRAAPKAVTLTRLPPSRAPPAPHALS